MIDDSTSSSLDEIVCIPNYQPMFPDLSSTSSTYTSTKSIVPSSIQEDKSSVSSSSTNCTNIIELSGASEDEIIVSPSKEAIIIEQNQLFHHQSDISERSSASIDKEHSSPEKEPYSVDEYVIPDSSLSIELDSSDHDALVGSFNAVTCSDYSSVFDKNSRNEIGRPFNDMRNDQFSKNELNEQQGDGNDQHLTSAKTGQPFTVQYSPSHGEAKFPISNKNDDTDDTTKLMSSECGSFDMRSKKHSSQARYNAVILSKPCTSTPNSDSKHIHLQPNLSSSRLFGKIHFPNVNSAMKARLNASKERLDELTNGSNISRTRSIDMSYASPKSAYQSLRLRAGKDGNRPPLSSPIKSKNFLRDCATRIHTRDRECFGIDTPLQGTSNRAAPLRATKLKNGIEGRTNARVTINNAECAWKPEKQTLDCFPTNEVLPTFANKFERTCSNSLNSFRPITKFVSSRMLMELKLLMSERERLTKWIQLTNTDKYLSCMSSKTLHYQEKLISTMKEDKLRVDDKICGIRIQLTTDERSKFLTMTQKECIIKLVSNNITL